MQKELPEYASSYFEQDSLGEIRWLASASHRDLVGSWDPINPALARRIARKLAPFGELAGWRNVYGHGRLVQFSRNHLLTGDVRAMLNDGGRWPCESGVYPIASIDDCVGEHLYLIKQTWTLDASGAVVWAIAPHVTRPAGSPAQGVEIHGRRGDSVLTRSDQGYLRSDVKRVLLTGSFT